MASLYELGNDYKAVLTMIDTAETEEDMKAIKDTLEMINESIEVKAENTAKFIKNLESDILGLKAEIDRLSNNKKRIERAIDTLKNNIDNVLKAKGVTKLDTDLFKFSYRKSESVQVDNINLLPEECKKITVTADKTTIKQMLKNNMKVAGAVLVEKQNLQIR